MSTGDPAALLECLASAATRLRAAGSVNDVLSITAEEARVIASAPQATVELDIGAPAGLVIKSGGADPNVDAALAHLAVLAGFALDKTRALDTAVRARELLLSSVAHDLRNPLNTFAMSAGLLRDDAEREDIDAKRAISLITRMERATSRMQHLIDDLLEASRIDAKKVDYSPRDESAAKLASDAVDAATAKTAGEKAAKIVAGTLDDGVQVRADRARTLQLLSKIIAFEVKATGEGGTVRVDVARDGAAVAFTVSAFAASGAPIPALPVDDGRGGLALLIARGLAGGQRGEVRVASGGGLVVSLMLPAASE